MTAELKAPMTGELVWANVMRPRIPFVYLDLNTIIYIARALTGDTKVPESYVDLYTAARRARFEQRAMFPLSGQHLWEISKITDPKQRGDLADILETLSDYNYLLGRTVIAELEFEAGMAKIMGEDISAKSVPLVRPTFWPPHTQVAISLKTRYHKNPLHRWTVNDIVDIDAISIAYAYCEAGVP